MLSTSCQITFSRHSPLFFSLHSLVSENVCLLHNKVPLLIDFQKDTHIIGAVGLRY